MNCHCCHCPLTIVVMSISVAVMVILKVLMGYVITYLCPTDGLVCGSSVVVVVSQHCGKW